MRRSSSPSALLLALACAGALVSCTDEPTGPSARPIAGPHLLVSAAPSMRMIWQNTTTGERSLWLMQGSSWDGSAVILPQVPPAWSIAGSADFNADGNADIVWQNITTGERSIWFMTGNAFSSAALLPPVPTAWSIAGVADFNADGKPDIVWQNTSTGERSIWFMNGATFSRAVLLPQVPPVWSIAAVGDFNADNKPDLVWQNAGTGERSIWLMNGSAFSSAVLLPTVPTAWKIAAAADFNGDSNPDLVWQNTVTGERSIWNMSGSTFTGAVLLPTVPTQWSIAGVMSLGTQSGCSAATAIQISVGTVRTLTASEKASLCVGGGGVTSEYVLIPFNSTNVAASSIQVQVAGTNTLAIQPGGLASLQIPIPDDFRLQAQPVRESFEWGFRNRERADLAPILASWAARTHAAPEGTMDSGTLRARFLTGIPATPVVGTTVQINASLSGNTCSSPKVLTNALVIAVLPHTIVLSDNNSPAGGYTSAEMISFGQSFDTLGYALDVANFGAPSDMDANGRIAILFTPSVNALPAPPGATVGGLHASRDLFPVSSCVASNEGEMFYMPVPDPGQTINPNYSDKAALMRGVLPTLGHELQHLINAGRRIYVNNAPAFEEVWLNEGLSHIAEELLYYRISGNSPRTNINLAVLQSSQAQLDAVNGYQIQNLSRLVSYMQSPEINSPFSQVDGLQMRGAIWELLRYSADRKGGVEATTWSALVNTTLSGQANFNAVLGNIITNTRDWAVAQYADDAGFSLAATLTNPSWNFRSVLPAINGGTFPLLTHPVLSTPVSVTLNGGGASYLRFGAAASVPATIAATSAGVAVPAAIDFMLVRTR